MKAIKYVLLTNGASYLPELLGPEIERAGLLNWVRVFDGDHRLLKSFKDGAALSKYDIIHINLAGQDLGTAAKVRKMIGNDSRTKIVVNMDLTIHSIEKMFSYENVDINTFNRDLIAADMVFAVEPHQVNMLSYFMNITGKKAKTKRNDKAFLIPHPINTDKISYPVPTGLFAPYDQRLDVLAYHYHVYDGHQIIPKMLLHDLPSPEEGGIVFTAMLGYNQPEMVTANMMDMVMPYTEWAKHIYILSNCMWGFEYRTHAAASRFVMEGAALGIPIVTTNYSYLGKLIFPDLCHRISDFRGLRRSLTKIITDKKFYLNQAKQGIYKVAQFSFSNSMKRFLQALT